MPLYDVTGRQDQLVDPSACEDYIAIQALQRKLPAVTYKRVIKTIAEAVDSVRPSSISRLVWTRAAALFGHGSLQPKAHIDHLWNAVISAVGDDKECLQAVGALLRMEIAKRPETWLVYRRETGEVDPVTGKDITISEYWINEDYVFRPKSRPKKEAPRGPEKVLCGPLSLGEQLARHFPPTTQSRVLVKRKNGYLEPTPTI